MASPEAEEGRPVKYLGGAFVEYWFFTDHFWNWILLIRKIIDID